MQAAESSARRFHRSTAEQIEYWAELGRAVSSTLDPDILLSISAGLARLQVEPLVSEPVDPASVFASLDANRASGKLTQEITSSALRYQASATHPGYIECINSEGEVTVGQFQQGEFIALTDARP